MRFRVVFSAIAIALAIAFIADLIVSYARLRNIEMVVVAPDKMVADGRNKLSIKVTVFENGEPRGRDMVQCWIVAGDGKLLPAYFFLDENGQGETWFTPIKLNRYSPTTAELAFEDISIGKLIEVRKKTRIYAR